MVSDSPLYHFCVIFVNFCLLLLLLVYSELFNCYSFFGLLGHLFLTLQLRNNLFLFFHFCLFVLEIFDIDSDPVLIGHLVSGSEYLLGNQLIPTYPLSRVHA